jgi:hypothetical protein
LAPPLARQQAQWIWALNLVCFLAHTAMIFVTYHFAYWRHDLDPMDQTKHVMIPIYRIRNIPTQHMLDTNQSRWSEGWNLTSPEPNSGLFLHDNGRPINLATLIVAFFATSAVFHFCACVAGAFERWCARCKRSNKPEGTHVPSRAHGCACAACRWFWYWRCACASNRPCAQTALTPTPVRRQANGRRLPLVALGGGAPRAPTAAVASNRARTHPRPGCPPVLHLGLAHGHGAGHRARHPRAEHGNLQAN